MPHNIMEHDTMVSANGVVPWHRLGTVVPGGIAYDDVLRLAGLDWEVELMPVYAGVQRAGETHDPADPYRFDHLLYAPDQQAVVRRDLATPENDRVIAIVGADYQALQNSHGLEFLRLLMDAGDIEVETAGSLRNNRLVWVCARMDRTITIDGDETVPYLVFSTSHDGSQAAGVVAGPVRVVCNNTLTLSEIQAVRSWRTRHVGDIRGRVAEAREALAMGSRFYDAFETEVQTLMAQNVSARQWTAVVGAVVPIDRDNMTDRQVTNREVRRDQIQVRYLDEQNTAWGAIQAVNGYELWDRTVRGADDPQTARAARQAMAVLRGRQRLTDRAHRVLLAQR